MKIEQNIEKLEIIWRLQDIDDKRSCQMNPKQLHDSYLKKHS